MSARTRTSRKWIAAVAAAASLLLAGCASSALRYRFQPRLAAPGADLLAALTIAGGNEAVDGNRTTLLENGNASFGAMLADIAGAQSSIHLETFIFNDGSIGRAFVDALIERAAAGVSVRLLLDALGSSGFGGDNVARLEAAGADVIFFNPLKLNTLFKVHLRTHRKILVVDGRIAFTGGVCIDDEWAGDADREEAWRDTMIRVEGPVVRQIQAGFARAWVEATREVLSQEDLFPRMVPPGTVTCQAMESVPGFSGNPARLAFLVAVASARRSVDITNAYFVPDDVALDTLIRAAKRGVHVRLLLPSRHTDHKAVRYAGRTYYQQMLAAGIEIWEYEASRMHAKTMVVDDEWSSVGSTNLDRRSFLWNHEMNLNVFDVQFAAEMTAMFERDLLKSSRVELEAWKHRPLGEKISEFFYGLLRSQY